MDYLGGGGGRVTGGSLLSMTALLVCIPAGQLSERVGHFFRVWSFIFLWAGGGVSGFRRLPTLGGGAFGMHTSG